MNDKTETPSRWAGIGKAHIYTGHPNSNVIPLYRYQGFTNQQLDELREELFGDDGTWV